MKVHNDIVTALDQQFSADWSIGQLDLSDFDVIDHGILSQRLTVSYGFRDSGLNHSYTGEMCHHWIYQVRLSYASFWCWCILFKIRLLKNWTDYFFRQDVH